MKAIKIAVVMILGLNLLFSLYSWVSEEEPTQEAIRFEPYQKKEIAASEGLDLKSLTSIVKEVRSGQELERKLNEKNGINNMDLNEDDKVDYVFVSEFGNIENKIGYSLTVQPVKDETQEIATVEIEQNGDKAEIQVIGNEQIYGEQAIFNDWTQIEREVKEEQKTGSGHAPMYSSYFYPRPLWMSPWHFGFYPSYFSFFPIIGHSMYMNRMSRSYSTTTVQRGRNNFQKSSNKKIASPNRGKTANKGISRSLKKPTATQKKFQVNRNRSLKSGGFGKTGTARNQLSSKRTGANRLSSNRSTRVRSQRSSSFGSSSFRSSGTRSRSFSFGK